MEMVGRGLARGRVGVRWRGMQVGGVFDARAAGGAAVEGGARHGGGSGGNRGQGGGGAGGDGGGVARAGEEAHGGTARGYMKRRDFRFAG
eukprot:CAMPEP_0194271858 /NCGR_PEP_ID=MMETSP0169-20130528/5561_1 /TAXON_ID=218684 /ORGANISM="Corethron pennatum, Strain L29A3" /LENGTH=89 /DNA_ID=CAMNT_0039014353 /DNA_START=1 /DNA_END=266 /DNA_ORIENTATION=-